MAYDPSPAGLNDPLAALLGYQLRRASMAVLADLTTQLASLKLKPAESSVLLLIEANPGLTQSEIGRQLAIKSANMTPLVAGLEQRALLVREQVDGRSHGLTLTETGARLCEKARDAIADHEGRLSATISVESYARLVNELQRMWS